MIYYLTLIVYSYFKGSGKNVLSKSIPVISATTRYFPGLLKTDPSIFIGLPKSDT